MREEDKVRSAMFRLVAMEARIMGDHPAREIRAPADRALARMDFELEGLYSAPLPRLMS